MPLSKVKNEVRNAVRKTGYMTLAWALQRLIEHEQYNLAAMIIVALCLAPRKTELENNGVLSVLKNFKLQQLAQNTPLMDITRPLANESEHDKIMTTLIATGWQPSYDFFPQHTNNLLETDDDVMFYTPAMRNGEVGSQVVVCDLAGCQYEHYFAHTRLIWDGGHSWVRVIGKQMKERSGHKMGRDCKELPNGYFEYLIPSYTVINRMRNDLCGRTLADI
ncbi:MAG: hypothetical protein AAB871_01770, partial [Patescibacteria group bacterium]